MRIVVTASIAMTCLFFSLGEIALAQPGGGVAVGFQNHTKTNVIIQGYTIVNNVQRRGPSIMLNKGGGKAFENNVPSGVRYYTIYDQTARVLLRDFPVQVQNANLFFSVMPSSTDPNRVVITPSAP